MHMNQGVKISLPFGKEVKIRGGFIHTYFAAYAGKISEYIASIAIVYSSGHHRSSYNIFVERTPREIELKTGTLIVDRFDAESMDVRYIKN